MKYFEVGNCLHCGGAGRIDRRISGSSTLYRIRCTKCGIATREYPKLRFAVAAWNRRAGDWLPEGLRSVIEHNRGA